MVFNLVNAVIGALAIISAISMGGALYCFLENDDVLLAIKWSLLLMLCMFVLGGLI